MAIAKVEPLTTARALRGPFDYRIPGDMVGVGVGSVLVVPFGRRRIHGLVVDVVPTSDLPPERLVEPIECLEAGVPPELVDLGLWVADALLLDAGARPRARAPARHRHCGDGSRRPRPRAADGRVDPGGPACAAPRRPAAGAPAARGAPGARGRPVAGRRAQHSHAGGPCGAQEPREARAPPALRAAGRPQAGGPRAAAERPRQPRRRR